MDKPSMTAFMSTAPAWLAQGFESATKWTGIKWFRESGEKDWEKDERRRYPDLRGAEAVGSCVDVDGWNRTSAVVAFDFDNSPPESPSARRVRGPFMAHVLVPEFVPDLTDRDAVEQWLNT
jgi:hypothetical protein